MLKKYSELQITGNEEILSQNNKPIKYAIDPPTTEKKVVSIINRKNLVLFANIYAIKNGSVGIGKKIDSISETI